MLVRVRSQRDSTGWRRWQQAALLSLFLAASAGLLCGLQPAAAAAPATDKAQLQYLRLDNKTDTLSANIQSATLAEILSQLAGMTHWLVFIEPDTTYTVSAKFKNKPMGDALRLLFGPLNFAVVPGSGGPSKLFVFRTSLQEATEEVKAKQPATATAIPDELIVKLKPGINPDELAKSLGAKVIGRIEGLNAYRLKFDNELAANTARDALSHNPAVDRVENNYTMELPTSAGNAPPGSTAGLTIQAKPLGNGNPVVVALIDTQIQALGNGLDKFMLKPISVAGDVTSSSSDPTHATTMFESLLMGLQALNQNDGGSTVKILPVDVFGSEHTANTFNIALGLYQASQNKPTPNMYTLSLSGYGDSQILREAVNNIIKNGSVLLAAAGNDPTTAATYPASYPGVIAVTAGDKQGNVANYANYGDFVKIVAPGTAVIQFGGQAYTVTGTSVSCAFTAGLAAAIAEKTGKPAAEVQAALAKMLPAKK